MTASHLRRNALALLCVLGLPAAVLAREGHLRFGHLTMDQRLTHNLFQAVLKDSRRFLRIGTENGRDGFDGSGIKIRRLRIGAPSPIEPCQVCRQEGTS